MLARKSVARGVLILCTLLLALLASSSPASASSPTPAPGVEAVGAGGTSGGGQGSAYNWKVYGNGHSSSTTSAAWKSFVNNSYKPCGTNCRNDFAGKGKYNWKANTSVCRSSAYIWAKVLREGYVNQRGYSQSVTAIAKALPKHAGKGSREYAQFRKEAVDYLSYVVPHSNRFVVILCSGALG